MNWNNTQITIKRHVTVNGKTTFANQYTGVDVYIEPLMGSYKYQDANLLGFRLFRLISETAIDLLRGDRVVDSSNNEYTVYELMPYTNNLDLPNHTEAVLTLPA